MNETTKTVRIQGAKKFLSRTAAEKIAAERGGSVGVVRILDELELREVYTVEFPYNSRLRFARRAEYVGRPCYLAAVSD